MDIIRIEAVSDLARSDALIELVDQIQAGPPYSYAPGEIPSANAWFTGLVARAELTLVALGVGGSDSQAGWPLGYCVALSWEAYGKLDGYAARLGIDPATTMYLAELGVAPAARRRGLASRLLAEFDECLPAGTSSCVIRTLADNAPAIALYQKHRYQLIDSVQQTWHGRTRVFLARHDSLRQSDSMA